jgi:hypothetical protein
MVSNFNPGKAREGGISTKKIGARGGIIKTCFIGNGSTVYYSKNVCQQYEVFIQKEKDYFIGISNNDNGIYILGLLQAIQQQQRE